MYLSKAELNELKMNQSRLEDMLKARMAGIERFKSNVLTTVTTGKDASITMDKVLTNRLNNLETRLNAVSERQVNSDDEVTVTIDSQVIDGAEYATMTITNNKGDIIVSIEDTPAGTKISGRNITINQQGGTTAV